MKFLDKPYRNLVREVAYSQYAVRDQNSALELLRSDVVLRGKLRSPRRRLASRKANTGFSI
jgi:hypothetical protein